MDYRKSEISLLLMTLIFMFGQLKAFNVKGSDCKNQTQPIPITKNGGEIVITTNNCTESVVPQIPTVGHDSSKPPWGKKLNITIKDKLITELPLDANSDSRIEDGAAGTALEALGKTSEVDDSLEVDKDLGSEGTLFIQTPFPSGPTTDPKIGEGNLLCPENWVCSREGTNRTMIRPKGIVMKAIPYIGLTSLGVMALMAVAAALWLSRDRNNQRDIFQMKRMKGRREDYDGCSGSLSRDPNVTVNMLALNNNPKDPPGMTSSSTDSLTDMNSSHDYSLPDVVTNEGIDSNRTSRLIQAESLYMELPDMQNRMYADDGFDHLGSTSRLIQNKRTSGMARNSDRKSFHVYYQPVPILPDIQQDIQEDLPNVGQIPPHSVLPNPVSNIPVPNDLPPPSDYYPVHIPGFQVPEATLPELNIYSDLPHASVYEVNERANRRSLMPPMDGMSSTTTSIAGGSVYTLQGPILDGEMIRDVDAEALYEQIEDRDRRSWTSSGSSNSNHSTFAPLLSLVPSREDLGMGPVMFANMAAHQRENYDKIDRTKRTYNKPMEYFVTEDDYNSLVMRWPRDEGY